MAPALLGAVLTSQVDGHLVAVRVTEVEAYAGLGEDPGSHAFRRMTARNATMFGPAGRAYVYFTYGMHWCVNVVTGPQGTAGAVLIRAGEVVVGEAVARARRPTASRGIDLARGPARLSAAMGIDGRHDGVDLMDPSSVLTLELPSSQATEVSCTPRTGVHGAGAPTPWRFILADPTVSPYRPARPRRKG